MATLQQIRQQYPQYSDLSNRELLDGIRNKFYPDIPQEEFYTRALGGTPLPEQPSTGDIFKQQAVGALRQSARMVPIIGGFADDIEASVRAIGDTTKEEELAKIRAEQDVYEQRLEQAGVKGISTAGEIGGSIAGGIGALGAAGKAIGQALPRAGQFANTLRGQMAIGSGIGAVEGAGFADENAGTGAVVGGTVGGAVPIIGKGIARAMGSTEKFAGKSITDALKDDEGTKTIIQGIDANPQLASEMRQLSQNALENTEGRVKNIVIDKLRINSIDDIAAPAKAEYSDFITKNADKKIPVNKVLPLYRKANVNRLAKQLRADNPDTLGQMPLNSVGFLQELKSTASARGRTASENAPEWAKVGRDIKGTIDQNFSGFKELNKKFAKAIQAEELAQNLAAPKGRETSNLAKSLLTTKNKQAIVDNFGKDDGSRLIKALREESTSHDNLKSVATKSRNRAQDRGSLNVLFGDSAGKNIARGATVVGASTFNPLLGAALAGGDIGARVLSNRAATTGARELLQGGQRTVTNPLLQALGSQQASRLGGQQ